MQLKRSWKENSAIMGSESLNIGHSSSLMIFYHVCRSCNEMCLCFGSEKFYLKKPLSCVYCRLKSVWVARNPAGFAFVEFEDSRDADDAIAGLDGK